MPGILVVSGESRGSYAALRGGRLIAGRGTSCDLQIVDAAVSRHHFEVRRDVLRGAFVLLDLGSTNGVRVDGRSIVGAHVLEHGDLLEVGGSKLVFSGRDVLDRQALLNVFKRRGEDQRSTLVWRFRAHDTAAASGRILGAGGGEERRRSA